jgi:hypothetical protein
MFPWVSGAGRTVSLGASVRAGGDFGIGIESKQKQRLHESVEKHGFSHIFAFLKEENRYKKFHVICHTCVCAQRAEDDRSKSSSSPPNMTDENGEESPPSEKALSEWERKYPKNVRRVNHNGCDFHFRSGAFQKKEYRPP